MEMMPGAYGPECAVLRNAALIQGQFPSNMSDNGPFAMHCEQEMRVMVLAQSTGPALQIGVGPPVCLLLPAARPSLGLWLHETPFDALLHGVAFLVLAQAAPAAVSVRLPWLGKQGLYSDHSLVVRSGTSSSPTGSPACDK